MHTPDFEILSGCRRWLAQGDRVWLATIVRTTGSSPRPVGAMLACNHRGEQIGSLSGGCIEEDVLQRVREGRLAHQAPELIEYGINAEENERLGLPSGGRLHVLIEPLDDRETADSQFVEILETIAQRRCVLRITGCATGSSTLEPSEHFQPLHFDEQQLVRCFGPRTRMLLVGAGQLAQSLSELAQAMDYEVLVTDPREHMLAQWAGPDLELLPGMPDDVLREHADDPHSVIITLTHDPRIDDMALMEALKSDAWYIGALGSQRTTDARKQRLAELGLSATEIARLHAPVGLDIGSKTPLEIAVSIMAQLTQLRRR